MKTLYFDCPMGAAGDMLMGALFELSPNPVAFLQAFQALQLPGVTLAPRQVTTCGVRGVHMAPRIDGAEEHEHDGHPHRGVLDVQMILDTLPVSDWVRQQARAVYDRIAAAEAAAHQMPVEQVHFHEVGALDAIGDVVGVCMLIEQLAPAQILASAVSVGRGTVHCAHGTIPVPAPATAHLLQGVPTRPGPQDVVGELCTPTGAALLVHFVQQFGPRPEFADARIGRGFGTKKLFPPNCVGAWLGETDAVHAAE